MIITLRPEPLLSRGGSGGGFSAASTAAVGPEGPLMSRARRGRSNLLGICRGFDTKSANLDPCWQAQPPFTSCTKRSASTVFAA